MASSKLAVIGKGLLALACLVALIGVTLWVGHEALRWTFLRLNRLSDGLATALVTGAFTVFVAALTIAIGRIYERKKDIEAAHRASKIVLYDEFLQRLFEVFAPSELQPSSQSEETLVPFLREWQRKLILWASPAVIQSYIAWKQEIQSGSPSARAVILMNHLLLTIREDIGHSNWRLDNRTFVHFFIREADLFLAAVKLNPTSA